MDKQITTKDLVDDMYDWLKSETSPSLHSQIDQFAGLVYLKAKDDLTSGDPAVEANRQSLLDRSNVGIVKYGTTLIDNKGDLRYWLNHALEECLDQANYLRRAIMEIDNAKK